MVSVLLCWCMYMTPCSFRRLETHNADTQQRDQSEAAARNNRAYFDEWSEARPSSEWPASAGGATRRAQPADNPGGLSLVPAAETVPVNARNRGEPVHVRSVPGDVLGGAVSDDPGDAAAPGRTTRQPATAQAHHRAF